MMKIMLAGIAGLEFLNRYARYCLIQPVSINWVDYYCPGNDLWGARGIYGGFLCNRHKNKKKGL